MGNFYNNKEFTDILNNLNKKIGLNTMINSVETIEVLGDPIVCAFSDTKGHSYTIQRNGSREERVKRYFEELVGCSEEVCVRYRDKRSNITIKGDYSCPLVHEQEGVITIVESSGKHEFSFALKEIEELSIEDGQGNSQYDYIIKFILHNSEVSFWGFLAE